MSYADWMALVEEEVVEPGLPIIDPHHHLWPGSAPWPFPAYDIDDLADDTIGGGHNVVATVYVDSHANFRNDGPELLRPVGETEYVERALAGIDVSDSRRAGLCAAIVGFAELNAGAKIGELLDAHLAASSRMRGIRRMTSFDSDIPAIYYTDRPGMMMEPKFREGFAELAPRGLSYDAWLLHPQISDLIDLARSFPDTRIILDHLASPLGIGRYRTQRKEVFARWKADMTTLATCDNVVVKIGGLNMNITGLSAAGEARPLRSSEMAEMHRHFVLTTIDLFSPARCMFESNFPVDRMGASYRVLWNGFKLMTVGFSASERAEMFSGTAARSYRIDIPS